MIQYGKWHPTTVRRSFVVELLWQNKISSSSSALLNLIIFVFHNNPETNFCTESVYVAVLWLSDHLQNWDEILPNSYKTSGLKSPTSRTEKRAVWDGSFPKQRLNVAKELEADSVGYGASGKLLFTIIYNLSHLMCWLLLYWIAKLVENFCDWHINIFSFMKDLA